MILIAIADHNVIVSAYRRIRGANLVEHLVFVEQAQRQLREQAVVACLGALEIGTRQVGAAEVGQVAALGAFSHAIAAQQTTVGIEIGAVAEAVAAGRVDVGIVIDGAGIGSATQGSYHLVGSTKGGWQEDGVSRIFSCRHKPGKFAANCSPAAACFGSSQ